MSPLPALLASTSDEPLTSTFFLGIGILGLCLIVLQTITGIFAGHDGDMGGGHDISHSSGSSMVSIKTISALMLGFGFGGALLQKMGYSTPLAGLGGIVIGLVIGAGYFALMRSLYNLKSDGTSVLTQAINRSGTVYMAIPAGGKNAGEIQVSFCGRMQNVRAYTQGIGLPTGTPVKVVALHGDTALLVEKL